MKITNLSATRVRIPLETPYIYAPGSMSAFDNVIVQIETDEGITGFGESSPDMRSPLGHVARVAQTIRGPIGKSLIGVDPFDIDTIIDMALKISDRDLDCISGLDMALYDLMGKYLSQPVYKLLGGLSNDPIAVDFSISSAESDVMEEITRQVFQIGFQGVVVKVMGDSVEKGVEQTRRVRSVLPDYCTVRVDCNEGFKRNDAIEFINRIKDMDIEFVEQPVNGKDLEGMRLCRQVGVPIAADEGLTTLRDAIDHIRMDACDVFNIKVPRVGGLFMAKKMAAIADAAGLPVVVGGMTSFEIARSAGRHFAASLTISKSIKHEGPGPASQSLTDDVVLNPISRKDVGKANGFVSVPKSAGLGVDVSMDKISKYEVPVSLEIA